MSAPAARLTIDLEALAHNYATLKSHAGQAEMAPVVKADGYGLGAGPVARRLWAEGARRFFVARLSEGETLRAALGPQRPAIIHVLDGFTAGAGPALAASNLTPALTSLDQIAAAQTFAVVTGGPIEVGLHVDTGMNRQGLTYDEARAVAQAPDRLKGMTVSLIMSHLGSATTPADPRNIAQLQRFQTVRALFPDAKASLAASAGIFLGDAYRFDIVRPGVSLYGGGPEERTDARLRTVAILQAPILDIRVIRTGETLGYGAGVVVAQPTRVAIVGAGYADGVIRAARSCGEAWVGGKRRPMLVVNMDLIVIDIGDTLAQVGDQVELLGPNALLDDLATAGGTVAHEILVRLSARAERAYLGQV